MQIPYPQILTRSYPGPEGPQGLDTRLVRVGEGLAAQFGAFARELALPTPLLLVSDARTHAVAGQALAASLREAGLAFEEHVLPGERPKADDATLRILQQAIPDDAAFLIACGSGTINDLVKMAAFERGVRYGVVPTAASMNGYTSTISALSVEGVKRTLPARPPLWVLADLEVVRAAPRELAGAGFGDLLSKTTAMADWAMAHQVAGGWFSTAPHELVELAFDTVLKKAAGVGAAEPAAIAALVHALVLSGLSMAVAGSSSPASGGEHLISHYLDMTAEADGRDPALHGAQVAVGTLVCATLHEKLRESRPRAVQAPEREPWLAEVAGRFRGRQAEAVAREATGMHRTQEEADRWTGKLEQAWDRALAAAEPYRLPSWKLQEYLALAGAPTRIEEIGVTPEQLRAAYLHGREVRNRYTVLHLAADAGLLRPLMEQVLVESGVLE